MKISMIVAYGNNWEIGMNNQMLWHIPEDFKNFKAITSGHHIIMGRKTFESIGKPLPNRISIVLSNSGFKQEGAFVFSDVQEAFTFAKDAGEDELFIIGGANIYKTLFPYVEKLYLSEVDFSGSADAFLSPIDFSSWDLKEEKVYNEVISNREVKSPSWKFKVLSKK